MVVVVDAVADVVVVAVAGGVSLGSTIEAVAEAVSLGSTILAVLAGAVAVTVVGAVPTVPIEAAKNR